MCPCVLCPVPLLGLYSTHTTVHERVTTGIPELLKRAFTNLGESLFGTGHKFYTDECYLADSELEIAKR